MVVSVLFVIVCFGFSFCYGAGYSEKETVLKSKLGTILDDLSKINEKWPGLLIIGECAR